MKIQQKTSVVERTGIVQESEFKIKATSKAFSILSSGLYSNKILAIVREISCNAYDAHVAAGKKNVPIQVKLPTAISPTFVVKDFGTGLDHDQVINLYTTYFESTKSESNDFIGALGLGSKSPFSYVNAFSVDSRYNGTLRQYRAFLNEEGIPSISLMNETSTTEENGITISIDVKQADISAFHGAALTAYEFFDPVPIVNGTTFTPNTSQYDSVCGKEWKVRTNVRYNEQRLRVVQGLVAYPIDLDVLRDNGLKREVYELFRNLAVDFFVPIGEVDVAASRERLSYDKRTIRNLIIRFDDFIETIGKKLQQSIDECENVWAARIRVEQIQNGPYQFIYRTSNFFTWKGNTYTTAYQLMHDRDNITFQLFKKYHHRKSYDTLWGSDPETRQQTREQLQTKNVVVRSRHFMYNITAITNVAIVVDDTFKKGNLSRMKTYFSENGFNGKDDFQILYIRGESSSDWNTIETLIKEEFQHASVFYVSNLGKEERIKTAYAPKQIDEMYIFKGFEPKSNKYSRNTWEGLKQDLNNRAEQKVYVQLDRFTPVCNDQSVDYLDRVILFAKNNNIISKSVVYGLNKKQASLVKENDTWVSLFALIEQWLDTHEMSLVKTMNECMEFSEVEQIRNMVSNRFGLFNQNEFRKFGEQAHMYHSKKKQFNLNHLHYVCGLTKRTTLFDKVKIDTDRVKKEYNVVMTKLGMLQHINFYNVMRNKQHLQEFAEMVNMKFK